MNLLFDIEKLLRSLIDDKLEDKKGYKWGVNCNCFAGKEELLSGIVTALAIFRYRYQEDHSSNVDDLDKLEDESSEIIRIVHDINIDAEEDILSKIKVEIKDIDNTCIEFYEKMQSLYTGDANEKMKLIISKLKNFKEKYVI